MAGNGIDSWDHSGYHMVQIERDGGRDFTCTHCGAVYEISETPAHDSGSAACEVCDTIMMKWEDSAILIFRAKESIEDATRRYLFLAEQPAGSFDAVKPARARLVCCRR